MPERISKMLSKINIIDVDKNDPNVWEMISSGKVKGCFQIEGHLGKTWAKALKPRNILDLAALISIIRPGTLKAFVDGKSMTQHYVDRRHGRDKVPSIHASIDDVLKETYGVVVYQEQAMEIAVKMAGFDLKQADDLRKAIGKKRADLMKDIRIKFIEGAVNNNVKEEKASEVFDIIEKSSRYSFNKSHAVGYAYVSYWSAYVKYHFTNKYFKHWLIGADDKIDPDVEVRQLIMAAKSEGLSIKGPTFRSLEENFHWNTGSIYFGICNIKNVGYKHFLELKEGLESVQNQDLHWNTILRKVLININKRAVENLITVGTFYGLGLSRTEMLHEFNCYLELTDNEIKFIANMDDVEGESIACILEKFINMGLKKNGGQISTQARLNKIQDIVVRLRNPGRSLYDNPVVYAREEERLLGYAINHSELNACSEACQANTTCKEIADGKLAPSILAVIIKTVREHKTKKGDKMAFLSVEDESGELENIVVFPVVYEQSMDIIYEKATVLLCGEIKDKSKNSFIVDRIFTI